jgi:ParB-like chromosome segregation protein Spo0J
MGADRKTTIAMANVAELENNECLATVVTEKAVGRAKSLMAAFGVVRSTVVAQNGATYKVLNNQSTVMALNESGIKNVPVVIADVQGDKEEDLLALHLSVQTNEPSAISQGVLINKLLKGQGFGLGNLSKSLGVSKSWLCKRQSLALKLDDKVKALVSDGVLAPRTAEEVAKLPKEKQLDFAAKATMEGLSKDKVAKLVTLYNEVDTPEALKEMILENPSGVPDTKAAKYKAVKKVPTDSEKLEKLLIFAKRANAAAAQALKSLNAKPVTLSLDLLQKLCDSADLLKRFAEAILEQGKGQAKSNIH